MRVSSQECRQQTLLRSLLLLLNMRRISFWPFQRTLLLLIMDSAVACIIQAVRRARRRILARMAMRTTGR